MGILELQIIQNIIQDAFNQGYECGIDNGSVEYAERKGSVVSSLARSKIVDVLLGVSNG